MLLRDDPRFDARLWVGGMHLSPRFGRTIQFVERDGLRAHRTLNFLGEPPEPAGDAARALDLVANALREDRIQALALLGDRSETLAAGFAATIAGVPVVHIHGGEETEGAIDNACRHALTKLSHLHLVSHELHANRVLQMGEPPENVVIVGSPGLDNLLRSDLPSRESLERELDFMLRDPVVLVTLHAATLGADAAVEVRELASAMERVPATYVVTQPNSDAGGAEIAAFWNTWCAERDTVLLTTALGERNYWGLLRIARAMVGNSSSGIIEGPAAGVSVVNIGDRQRGRMRVGQITDVPSEAGAIESALRKALTGARASEGAAHPSGPAASRIVEAIAEWMPRRSPRKVFRTLP
jgi:UDP-hydrolysing UDP-N-acetyl-D-glucosamine 2-epimerase